MDWDKVKFRCFAGDTEKLIYDIFPVSDRVLIQRDEWLEGHFKVFNYECDEVEQFTGLLDCNGKEIYEGDIISFTVFDCFDHDTQYTGIIKNFGCGFDIIKSIEDEEFKNSEVFDLPWVHNQDSEIEIIGNIHENYDLISEGESCQKNSN